MGELSNLGDGEVEGKVFVINETAIQLVNFTYNGNGPGITFCFRANLINKFIKFSV